MNSSPDPATSPARHPGIGPHGGLPVAWALALILTTASLTGILALTSDLARTDALLTDGVAQVVIIDRTTTSGLGANATLPATDAAVQANAAPVLATAGALGRANDTLTTLAQQVETLADVLAQAEDPLVGTVDRADNTDQTVRRTTSPLDHVLDTLHTIDQRTSALHPALDTTLRLSRSIEAKLDVLGHLPALPLAPPHHR